MSNRCYNNTIEQMMTGGLDIGAGSDVRCLLLGGAGNVYVFDPDDEHLDDLTLGTNELSGTGYARQAGTGEAVTQDDTNDRVTFDLNDVAFGTLNADNGDIDAVVLYEEAGGADATRVLVAYFDDLNPALPFTTDGGTFTVTWNALGVIHATSPAA